MKALETELDKLIELIKPVPIGFLNSLGDTYRCDTPLVLRTWAAMNEVAIVPRPLDQYPKG